MMENKQRNRILAVLFLGVLMGALDIAIVGPALPAIRSEFNANERILAWVFSIYVLFNLIGTPLMAKLSDLFGRRLIYMMDIALFAAGSLLVAVSTDFSVLLVGRAIQGFGAGGIFPVASAVIGDVFPPEKRGSALGLIGMVFGLAFILGPILGGVIMSLTTWHWLFLINLPISVIIIVLAIRVLPASKPAQSSVFDWKGMLVLAAAITAFAYAINQLDTARILTSLISLQVWPFLAASILLILLFIPIEKKAVNPVLPGNLFNRRQLGLAYTISAGAGIGEASLSYLPLLAVITLSSYGVTQSTASFLLMPLVIAMSIASPLVGRMLDKFGSRSVIVSGSLLTTAGMFVISQFANSLAMYIVSGVIIGAGLSALLGAPIRYIMLNESLAEERSTTQGVASLFTSMGQLVGSAMVGAIAASQVNGNVAQGYTRAFFFIGLIGVLLVGLAWQLKSRQQEQAERAHA
jgi:EmrB/QacA subfamily drug resistance transporter